LQNSPKKGNGEVEDCFLWVFCFFWVEDEKDREVKDEKWVGDEDF